MEATQLNIFKHIKCPAGERCTSVRCLFRHEADETAPIVPLTGPLPQVAGDTRQDEKSEDADQSQTSPRKRLRTGEDILEYDPASPAFLLPETKESAAEAPETLVIIPANDHNRNNSGNGSGYVDMVPSDLSALGKQLKTKKDDTSDSSAATASPIPSGRIVASRAPITPPPLKRKRPTTCPAERSNSPPDKAASNGRSDPGKELSPAVPPADASPGAQKPARVPEGLNPRYLKSNPAKFEVRLRLVKMLHEQYTRLNTELKKQAKDESQRELVLSDQELIWMALDEEESAARDRPTGYSNVLKSRIIVVKKLTVKQWAEERAEAKERLKSLAASSDAADAKPKQPVVLETGLTPEEELLVLKAKLLTPINELSQFGYTPRIPTEEDITKAREAEEVSCGWEVCDRCAKRFQVFPGRREEDGALTSGGTCTHHPGKAYIPNRQTGDRSIPERQYRCCGETVGQSPGCATKDHHVFRFSDAKRLGAVWNFVETPENLNAPKDRAVCFDCEMGYTVKGFELIRLTATSWPGGEELIDVLVRPIGEILDLNSAYSGVWPEDMINALPFTLPKYGDGKRSQASQQQQQQQQEQPKKGERKRLQMVSSPLVARDLLFSLISRETPLIGHGLENDLNCLRIIHPTLVDTVLLFPHKRGLPIRNSLKMLMQTLLNRNIQMETEGTLQGHDSAEDARAAGDLVRWHVKKTWNTMKRDGWQIVDGCLVPPRKPGALKAVTAA